MSDLDVMFVLLGDDGTPKHYITRRRGLTDVKWVQRLETISFFEQMLPSSPTEIKIEATPILDSVYETMLGRGVMKCPDTCVVFRASRPTMKLESWKMIADNVGLMACDKAKLREWAKSMRAEAVYVNGVKI